MFRTVRRPALPPRRPAARRGRRVRGFALRAGCRCWPPARPTRTPKAKRRRASCCGWTAARRTRTPSTSSRTARVRRLQADRDRRAGHPDQRAPAEVRQADEARRDRPRHEHRRERAPRGAASTCTPATATGQGGLTYPSLGSIVSEEIGDPDFPAAELRRRRDRRPQLRPRLPRPEAPAADRQRPQQGVENLKALVDRAAGRRPPRPARRAGEGVRRRVPGRR